MSREASGTEGYAENADALLRQYESIAFADAHAPLLCFLPPPPARVLDIGAGTGRDAAGFAGLGYIVTAVEPTTALRKRAMALHPAPNIEWMDDSLPDLRLLAERGDTFGVVMLTAVWMHLDEQQRRHAMPRLVALIEPGGLMMISLRHGPVPPGRRMFEVTAAETIALAEKRDLECVQRLETTDSFLNRPGVSWDRLTFRKHGGSRPLIRADGYDRHR